MDSFYNLLEEYRRSGVWQVLSGREDVPVRQILGKNTLNLQDLACLLAPGARAHLEEMAQAANRLALRHFGRTILLYTPLYLGNYCSNGCLYCGFSAQSKLKRRKLGFEEVEQEARVIADSGLKHLLILTGESREHTPVSYIRDCLTILRRYFSSVSIEIYPLETEEYRELVAAGVDGITIYQEVYDETVYRRLHPFGPKQDYHFRLQAPERAGTAGMRTIGIGALLGLHDWRSEAFCTALHAAWLQDRFPEAEISISFPRLRPQAGEFTPAVEVSDRDLVQVVLAFRLFLPRAGLTLSTRERPSLRDHLIKLGVTKMSAGSSTVVGGHTEYKEESGQFEISDHRSVAEISEVIRRQGYKPIYKDWHPLEV